MNEILKLLPALFIAITMNIASGSYYNIGTKNLQFNRETLISGIIKAIIIALLFIGTAYCFDITDLSSIGIAPDFIMNSAITLYVGKTMITLSKILGIKLKKE